MLRGHRRWALLLTGLALLTPAASAAPDAGAKAAAAKLRELAAADSQVMAHLKYLSDEIGPRLTGSDGLNAAYQWTRAQFESYGLKAHLEEWGSYPVGFNRGISTGKMICALGEKELTFGTNAWTAGTKGRVRGLARFAPTSLAEAEARAASLQGVWIVSGAKRPRLSRKEWRALNAKIWSCGIAGWIRPTRGELIVTSGSIRGVSWSKLPSRVQVDLVRSEWLELTKLMASQAKVELEFNIRNEFKKGPYKHYNVVADLVGSERPDEFVIVGGHIDSWDRASGTTDNGTGVSTTLEAARLLAKLARSGTRPKRTIRFILWSGEEQGLLGSRGYVKAHANEMKNISAVLVHDGGTNTCVGIDSTAAMRSQLDAAFAPLMDDGSKFGFKIKTVKGLSGGGSDHNSYLGAGVPGFFWHQKGSQNYTFSHHTQHDNFDKAVPEYQRRSALVIATGAIGIANLPKLLNRTKLLAPRGARRKVLGVQVDGVTITHVSPDSIADKAGFKDGDKLISGKGQSIEDIAGLRSVIQAAEGATPFVVERDGKKLTLSANFPKASRRKSLGVYLDGLNITGIVPGSIAEAAGFQENDEIVGAGGEKLSDMAELREAIMAAEGPTKFRVKRRDKVITLIANFKAAKKRTARLY